MFRILLNRWALDRVYEPAYFEHLENPSFAEHFRTRAEHTLTQIPIWSNYFVHQMLTGVYPAGIPDGLPPYLSEQGATAMGSALDRLQLVDGTYTAYLRECPDSSVDAFVVSNICEWLAAPQIDELFTEIAAWCSGASPSATSTRAPHEHGCRPAGYSPRCSAGRQRSPSPPCCRVPYAG